MACDVHMLGLIPTSINYLLPCNNKSDKIHTREGFFEENLDEGIEETITNLNNHVFFAESIKQVHGYMK